MLLCYWNYVKNNITTNNCGSENNLFFKWYSWIFSNYEKILHSSEKIWEIEKNFQKNKIQPQYLQPTQLTL